MQARNRSLNSVGSTSRYVSVVVARTQYLHQGAENAIATKCVRRIEHWVPRSSKSARMYYPLLDTLSGLLLIVW